MDYYKQFHKHILNHDYAQFLSLWEEYCMGDEIEPKELKKILETVKESGLASPFGRHVENALILWEKYQDHKEAEAIFMLIIDLQTTNTPELADLTLTYLNKNYGDTKNFAEKIKLVGLRDRINFQGAVRNFILLHHLNVGNFVYHTGGWGVGEIMEASFIREQVSLEFDYVPGIKDLTFQNAFSNLLPIPKDHFLAQRFGNPDELEAFAKKEPITVIRKLLADLGPLTAAEIKDEMCELVIPEGEWQKWWQSTRAKIKKDTLIEVPHQLRDPFILRDQEVTHEEKLYAALSKKPDADDLIQIVYSFLRDFPNTLKNPDFRRSLQEKLTEALSSHELTDAQELQIHYFLQDVSPEQELSSVAELIKRFPSVEAIVKNIAIIAFKKRALQDIHKLRDEWQDVFINLLIDVEQNAIRDYLLQELLSSGKEAAVEEKLEMLLKEPSRQPQCFIWYCQKIMGKEKDLPLSDETGKQKFFESLLILLSQIEQSPQARDHVKKILTFITSGRYAHVRKIFGHTDVEMIKEYLLLASKCQSLTEHDIKIFHSLAEVVHPELKKLRKKHQVEEVEEEPIWTTSEGYAKLKTRIEEIATVETVENAKEIEVARSHGDLRENAEFKSALERRDRLQSELKLLSDQLNRARILTPEDIRTDAVSVGAMVDMDADGEETSFALLGPWEANPDEGILSFQSKLAQSLVGKTVGEKVSIQGKEYTIRSIKNYLEVGSRG